jgi:hypothetical protein
MGKLLDRIKGYVPFRAKKPEHIPLYDKDGKLIGYKMRDSIDGSIQRRPLKHYNLD